ncbi:unnamed protein product, partial [Urochloa humidicola]
TASPTWGQSGHTVGRNPAGPDSAHCGSGGGPARAGLGPRLCAAVCGLVG